jgi:lysophospholipase L1-like esterase
VAFNRWLREFADERGIVFADYHAVLAEPSGELKAGFSLDGVHLNEEAYAAMRPVLEAALAEAEAGITAPSAGAAPAGGGS